MAGINTVLFDFDGTVMDTNKVIIASWQHTFKTVEGKERPVSEIIRTFGEPLALTMKKVFPGMDVEKLIAIYKSYHNDNYGEAIKLFPGIMETLASLKEKGYKLGLVTSRPKLSTMLGLEKFEIKGFFDAVVTCDDTEKYKPDPEPIIIALEKLKSKPEESIMLGDTMFDILCAKNAGVKSVLIGGTIAGYEKEKITENAPDYIIENVEELFGILKKEQRYA